MLDLPASLPELGRGLPATRTRDLDVARTFLGGVFTDHDLVADRGASLDFVHQQARLGALSVSVLRYGSEVEVVAPPLPDFYLFQLMLSGRTAIAARGFEVELAPGSLFMMNPGIAYRKRWDAEGRQLMIKIPRGELERRLMADLEGASLRRVSFDARVLAPNERTRSLFRLLGFLCQDLSDGAGLLSASLPLQRQVDDVVLTAILATVPHDRAEALEGPRSPAVPRHVRRAEAYCRERFAEPIAATDLAAAAGVSERTLQDGFRRFRGTTPGQFLRDLRLDRARALLREGPVDQASVTRVALAVGFNHLGRFAQAYSRRFGEAPSATVRGRP
jgi:AraC-like DNA-binding protein